MYQLFLTCNVQMRLVFPVVCRCVADVLPAAFLDVYRVYPDQRERLPFWINDPVYLQYT